MKKFKISLFAVIAIAMEIVASAFIAAVKSPNINQWFTYDGSGPLNDPASYTSSERLLLVVAIYSSVNLRA